MKKKLQMITLFMMSGLLLSGMSYAQELQLAPGGNGFHPAGHYEKDDGEWIKYWENVNENALGLGGDGAQWFAAIRWMPEDLEAYENYAVSKIRVFMNDQPNNATATIWQGDIDNPMVMATEVMGVAEEDWVEVEFAEPYLIDISQELWIGWEIGDPGDGVFPSAFETSTEHNTLANLLQFGDNPWNFASAFGFDVVWNIEAFVIPFGDDILPPADPLEMFTIVNKTGADVPAEIGEGGNARSAALYLDRYIIVPSREGGPEVWVWDAHNPDDAPFALNPGDGYVGGLFPVNYVQTVGEHIYVSNMSLGSDEAQPFKVYRWDGLDAAPELILSADAGYGRLGDAFSIIGDPAADGHIIAHVNSGGEGQRTFRKWNFVGGVNQNPDAPELITIDADVNMNSYGVFNTIEGEDELFLITGNVMGIGIADLTGQVHAYISSEIVPTRTMDPCVFYHNGHRYLSYVVNKEWDTTEGSYYDVIDISMGDNVIEAFSMITTMDDLDARRAHSFLLGAGASFLSGTHQVSHTDDGEIMLLSHVVARGFVLESTAPLTIEPDAPENLIHYWHFNDQVIADDAVPADYSAVGQGVITYPGTGAGYMDFRTHRAADPVSDFNLQMGQEPAQGAVLRVRNPADTRELIIAAPSTGYQDLVVTFASTRTENGGQQQEFYFSHDNGATWTMVGDVYDIPELDPELDNYGYLHKIIDLSAYALVNDNEHLHFKILAVGEGADNTSGNQRFDNLTLEGEPVSYDHELVHYWHFNDEVITDDDEVPADFSAVGQGVITYPGTGAGYMDFRTHRAADPVSNFNLRMGQEPNQGAVLRVRNPADTRELIIAAPSTGYEDLVVTFATTRTDNGGQEQEFYFSADNGASWVQVGDAYDVPVLDPETEGFGYLHKVIDLSAYPEVNNNHELHFKILSVGEGADNTSGNQRFDNFTVDGVPVDVVPPPVALDIVAVNQGSPVYVNEAFSLTVQTLNEDGAPAIADADYVVSLSLATGSGALSGNLTGTIAEGSTSVVIEGILYDAAESGVSITAAAEGLEAATSEAFDVLVRTYNLSLTMNIAGAGVLSGEGDYEEGEAVTIAAVANDGFEFVNWTIAGEVFATDAEYTFNMLAEDLVIRANFDEEITGDVMLMHYFHFNEMTGAEVTEVHSDYSIGALSAMITYPGTGAGYMDARTHREADPVSNFNLRQGQEPDQGAVLRVRNPANTRELLFEIPSTGFSNLTVMFATTRTENGGQEQRFEYSADGGATWVQPIDDYAVPFFEDEEGIYLHVTIDLSGIQEVNDNPDLHFRILSVGEGNDNPSGNQRFDNFTVDGIPLDDDVSITDIDHLPGIFVSPNPARGPVNITVEEPGTLIRVFSVSGAILMQTTVRGEYTTIDTSNFDSGLYIIQGIAPSTGVPTNVRLLVP